MHCPKCGAENSEGVEFCQSCSGALDWSETPAVTEPAKTSGLAIASLVCGILSPFTCYITFFPAVILAIVAFVKMSKSNGRLKGTGFAITGIVFPVIAIPVLMAILMPALGRVKVLAQQLVCGTNMKGLSNAITVYAFDYDDKYPTGLQWCDLLTKHADVGPNAFVCPSGEPGRSHYALNVNALRLGENAPADMVLMFECGPGWNQVGGPELLRIDNHMEGCNIMFVDGYVVFIPVRDLDNLRWTVE